MSVGDAAGTCRILCPRKSRNHRTLPISLLPMTSKLVLPSGFFQATFYSDHQPYILGNSQATSSLGNLSMADAHQGEPPSVSHSNFVSHHTRQGAPFASRRHILNDGALQQIGPVRYHQGYSRRTPYPNSRKVSGQLSTFRPTSSPRRYGYDTSHGQTHTFTSSSKYKQGHPTLSPLS
ncbi:hypothetical protein BCR39DRAFT_548950 [Naematelia encephala]|uniref:Uncharacterized protein n=1 Tax=Naematelia encephala TaxID=71784 RepID=A0A1Y2AM18_9TREE|nr:hypothetical protein BCR39DRAFT_548950 [Naematelia encephala]